jgi:hypothetical protein
MTIDTQSLLLGGLTYVGIPVAVGLVEGVPAGETTAATLAGGGIGGLLGGAIGTAITGGIGGLPTSTTVATGTTATTTTTSSTTTSVLPTILSLVGAVAGGLAGLNLWRAYKGSGHETLSSPAQLNPRRRYRANPSKIKASSFERYNGGARIKRQYGSSTVTRFYVYREEDEHDPSKWVKVEGYGPTPGDRKTDAIRKSGLL